MLRRAVSRRSLSNRSRDKPLQNVTPKRPRGNIKPKWLKKAEHLDWLHLDRWLDLFNNPPTEESFAGLNFGIRNYRTVSPEEAHPLIDWARQIIDSVVREPRPAGISHREARPSDLFLAALAEADLTRIKCCPVCGKYFFASRRDKKACSDRCSHVERSRHYRLNQRMYEEHRKKNRVKKQQREELHRKRSLDELAHRRK
jgi:hypothetical protein